MDRETTLAELGAAKKAHVKWTNRAKSLVGGIPVEKDAIPVDSTECAFGTWFYGEGQKLKSFSNMGSLGVIESLHFQLHDHYLKIFTIYFGEGNRSFFNKLLKMKKKVSEEDKEQAKEYFKELEEISKNLLDEISKLERRLHAVSAESFRDK